ncbi:hypothetical protein LXM94_16525 [Rhizobium sp. TRM95111]|uniref:hypothetical protein n=1 Tax=Rhizobium alarense TaxID=2846851 RepID=UPI001F2B98AD|nr:hypothetical protein [Rhizobium alarense]MCF3641579.1 hypothetical protein [Rhizobium alarense]
MSRRTTYRMAALGLLVALFPLSGAAAQDAARPDRAIRDAYAVLFGLAVDGEQPVAGDRADIFYSIIDNPAAPRLVTRLEVSGTPCRARTTAALQFPGEWASMTLAMADLKRIEAAAGYASVDDLMASRDPLPFDDPRVRHVVLTGKGLVCESRLSLDEASEPKQVCGDRFDVTMIDPAQRERGLRALRLMAGICGIGALTR